MPPPEVVREEPQRRRVPQRHKLRNREERHDVRRARRTEQHLYAATCRQ
jgi:hypothetical protein